MALAVIGLVGSGLASAGVEDDTRQQDDVTVVAEDVHQELSASTDRRVELGLPPGTYTFRCDVPGHETMEGALIVQ